MTAHALTDKQFAELHGFYSEGEIVELLCAIGLFNYFNRFNNALGMEPTKPGEGGYVLLHRQKRPQAAAVIAPGVEWACRVLPRRTIQNFRNLTSGSLSVQ